MKRLTSWVVVNAIALGMILLVALNYLKIGPSQVSGPQFEQSWSEEVSSTPPEPPPEDMVLKAMTILAAYSSIVLNTDVFRSLPLLI